MPAEFNPEDVLALRPDVDIVSLPLTAEEGFVVSRIDGRSTVHDLVVATGLPEERVLAAVQRLQALQALQVTSPSTAGAAAPDAADDELTGEERAEDVDLSLDQRQRIKAMAARAGAVNHYELLEIPRRAGPAEVKRAYLERSREFHPDSYFRKRLGSFKPMLEKVFRAVRAANEALRNPESRRKYDDEIGAEVDAAELRRLADLRTWTLDPKRQAEAADRRKRRNPMFQRIDKAQRHFKQAQDERMARRLPAALNEITLALAHDPSNPEIVQLHADIHSDIRAEKAARVVAIAEAVALRGAKLEGMRLPELARKALELESLNPVVYVRLGRLLFDSGELQAARESCERALRLDEDNVTALDVIADVYERAGMILNTCRVLEKLIKIKSTPERLERLKRLRALV